MLQKVTQLPRTRQEAALRLGTEVQRLDQRVQVLKVLPTVLLARAAEAGL